MRRKAREISENNVQKKIRMKTYVCDTRVRSRTLSLHDHLQSYQRCD